MQRAHTVMTSRKEKIQELLTRGIERVFPSAEVAAERLASDKPLKIYWGIDPTGSKVHLGHTAPLLFLKHLVELGHKAVLLIGDFTAQIGDPTDKEATRRQLTKEEVASNMATYLEQIEKILPRSSFEVVYNSAWLEKMSLEDVLDLASRATVQQMLVRDMFQERLKKEKPIHIHEFLYPLMQGYDSVALDVDGEVGGTDQMFNMLMGRELAKQYLGKDKLVFTRKLLTNNAGKKMSKSEGEIIALDDSPQEIRRKVLEIDDDITRQIFESCTERDMTWIEECASGDPRQFKEALADELVNMYHGSDAVSEAREPQEVSASGTIVEVLVATGLAPSKSAAKQLIDQKGVRVNGMAPESWDYQVRPGDVIRAGKGKFIKVSQ